MGGGQKPRVPGSGARDPFAPDLDRYLAYLKDQRGLGEQTIVNYRRDLSQFLSFVLELEVRWLVGVDRPLLRRWLSDLRGRGLAIASVTRRAIEVRAFLRYIAGPAADPFAGLRLQRPERRQRPVLSQAEVARLLAAPDSSYVGLRDRAIMAVLYATGLRVAELVALDLRQVDLGNARVLRWDRAGRPRPAFLGNQAAEMVSVYLTDARPVLAGPSERALFVSREGARIAARSVEHLVNRWARGLGLRASPNDLRAACAAHLRQGGATAIAVRSLLGTTLSNHPGPRGT